MIRNLFLLLFIFFQTVSFSQNLKADGKKIIDGNGNEVLLKGYIKIMKLSYTLETRQNIIS